MSTTSGSPVTFQEANRCVTQNAVRRGNAANKSGSYLMMTSAAVVVTLWCWHTEGSPRSPRGSEVKG